MIRLGPRCLYCKHYKNGQCTAFPERIPSAIIRGEVEHLTPYEGDHGIQFELDPTLSKEDRRIYRHCFEIGPK